MILSSRPRSSFETWILCNECNEGLQSTALPKPDRVHLLAQIRGSTIDDQEAVLDWLLRKFGKVAKNKTSIDGRRNTLKTNDTCEPE
ncbi:MAG: hypothetical protein ABIT76_09110 [Chthoniobacterales bacterium]